MGKMKKWLTRISYARFTGVVKVRSHKGTAFFHRIDRHEDGSLSHYYGIEVEKDEYERLVRKAETL